MIGVLGWAWRDIDGLTLAQLCNAYDARLLYDWDKLSHQLCMLDGLICTVVNVNTKKRMRPRHPQDFHPFREKKKRGLVIDGTEESMRTFRQLVDHVCGKVV